MQASLSRWRAIGAALLIAGCAASVPPAPTPAAPEAPEPEAGAGPAEPPAEPEAVAAPEAPAEPPPAAGAPAAKEKPSGPRIGSVRHITWVFSEPSKKSRQIGYIREGTSVPLVSDKPVSKAGCGGGWYAVAPYGHVCRDHTATLDLDGPVFKTLAAAAPKNDEVSPFRYGFSQGAPMYNRIPTADEQIKVEGPPEKRVKPEKLGGFLTGHEELAVDEPIAASDKIPEVLKGKLPDLPGVEAGLVRKWIPHGSMLAYSHAFESGGRTWLFSPDGTVVPADRIKPFRRSTFRGVLLDDKVKLPMAWSRHDAIAKYRKGPEGLVASKDTWPPRTRIELTGERIEQKGKIFWATREEGVHVLEGDAVLAQARDKLPALVDENQKWIDVHLRSGVLVAYAGKKPVFATLSSPGAGGVGASSASNEELVKMSATPAGIYRITWKTRAAVMTPETGDPKKFWIADVPHTMYFRPPFAIHTAYWHEDFGMPKSAGCINVSFDDGRWLYDWTDPVTPPDWQGSGPSKGAGVGTTVVIVP